MKFSEKLNFLLNLTNTPNNMLAKHLSLDPSYISRLRRGDRMQTICVPSLLFLPKDVPKNISVLHWLQP